MTTRILNLILILFIGYWACAVTSGQPPVKYVQVLLSPDHSDWIYKTGDQPRFNVKILKDNIPLEKVTIFYQVGPETLPPFESGEKFLEKGTCKISSKSLYEPGFLRLMVSVIVDGKQYSEICTVGFEPEMINPFTEAPSDFDEFWSTVLEESGKLPLDVRMIPLPERGNDRVNVYEVSIQSFREGARLYGILCMPSKPGTYPALLKVPGAGVWKFKGDVAMAEEGIISFEIGIHGIPLTLQDQVYEDLRRGALSGYGYQGYGIEDRENYYYKRVYAGCVKAIDFLFTLPAFDKLNLGVTGGSQGGALSMVTAALDKRVTCLAAFHPALCDAKAYLHGRAGGWPHYLKNANPEDPLTLIKANTLAYFDVVNFARKIEVPGFYSWGFNDVTCPPTSMHAAFNVIHAQKRLAVFPAAGHWNYPEQSKMARDWLKKQLLGEIK